MGQTQVIMDQIFYLGLIVLIGFLVIKTKYIKETVSNGLSAYLVRISVPCLVISTFASMDFTAEKLKSGALVLIISYAIIGLLLGAGKAVAKLLHFSKVGEIAHTYLSACGNVIFLGYPIVSALFGKEGLYYAMLYALANDSVVWSLSVFSLLRVNNKKENVLRKLFNPNTVSLLIGIVIMITGFRFPDVIQRALEGIGGTTTPVSMLFIGMTLATIKLSEFSNLWKAFFAVLMKMLLMPVILMYLFSALQGWIAIPAMGLVVIILEAAMPCQSIYAALAKEYGGDVSYATQCILVTTVCSFFTLPFIYFLIERMGTLV